MSWTLDTVTQGTYGANNPSTASHTCSANTRLLVLVIFVNGNTARTGGAPTYNTTETFTDSGQGFVVETECGVEVWYLLDPSTGGSYTVSVPNTGVENIDLSIMSFEPSTGNAAFDASNSTVGTTQNPSLTLTTVETNCLVIGALGSGDRDDCTAGTNYTLVHTYDAGNQTWGSEYDLDSGASTSVTVSFGTARDDDWGLIGVSFTDAGATLYQRSYAGSMLNTGALAGKTNKLLVNYMQEPSGAISSMAMNYPSGSFTATGFLDTLRSITRDFSGSILLTGTELNAIAKLVSSSITGTGNLIKRANALFVGSILGAASLNKRIYQTFTSSLSNTGFLDNIKTITKEFTGSILSIGTELKTVRKQFAGSILKTGNVLKNVYNTLTGSVLSSGELIRKTYKTFFGSILPTGVLDTLKSVVQEFYGSISLTGEKLATVSKLFSGDTAPAGTITKTMVAAWSGSIDFAQNLYKIIYKKLSAGVVASGVLDVAAVILRIVTGSIAATGELYKTANKNLAGSLDFVSERIAQINKRLVGVIQATGNLINQTSGVITVLATGALLATGEVIKRTSTTMSGALDWVGNTFKTIANTQEGYLDFQSALDKLYTKVLSVVGSLDFSSGINKRVDRLVTGGVNAVGQTIKNTAHDVSGQIATSGTAIRKSVLNFIGSMSATGSVATSIFKIINIVSSLLNSGELTRTINKQIGSSADLYGAMLKQINSSISGSIATTSTLYRRTLKNISSAISAVGTLAASLAGVAGAAVSTFKGMFKSIFKGMR